MKHCKGKETQMFVISKVCSDFANKVNARHCFQKVELTSCINDRQG